jgi:hypothetical protein
MEGVPPSALTIVSFSNSNGTRRLLRSNKVRVQSSPSLTIEYATKTTLESFNGQYSSVDAMVSDLNTQVSLAVDLLVTIFRSPLPSLILQLPLFGSKNPSPRVLQRSLLQLRLCLVFPLLTLRKLRSWRFRHGRQPCRPLPHQLKPFSLEMVDQMTETQTL